MYKEILVIDDNPDIRYLICNILEEQNFKVRSAANYDQAVLEINKRLPDLAIIDIKLDKPDKDGIDLLKLVNKKNKLIPIIMISGHATVQIAVEAIRLGAYEFIEKPFSKEKILNYVNRGLESATLKKEKDIIENKLFHSFDLIGKSSTILKTKKIIEKLATSESRVLISGPTGSGKELVARKIHKNSLRIKEPFVIINGKKSYYQRPLVWELEDKQLLIESIYNSVDCGKILIRLKGWEELRDLGHGIKAHMLSNLDNYLIQFEENAIKNGIQVHWAANGEEHNKIVLDIIKENNAKKVVKSKSMLTEECHLNPYLEADGIEVIDTDLGERIVQLAKEPPSHIVLPAIHKNRHEVDERKHEQVQITK